MDDYNSDQAKELRRARLLQIKPKAAQMMLTESEFRREYIEYRLVALEQMLALEEAYKVMFCPACVKNVDSIVGKRRVLHISYEKDALDNYPMICAAKCQGCEWEEMIPVILPIVSDEDRAILRRFSDAQRNQTSYQPRSPLMDPRQLSGDMLDAFKASRPDIMYRVGVGVQDGNDSRVRFGQVLANKVWLDVSKLQEDIRDAENARRQIDMIEQLSLTAGQAVGQAAVLWALQQQAAKVAQQLLAPKSLAEKIKQVFKK